MIISVQPIYCTISLCLWARINSYTKRCLSIFVPFVPLMKSAVNDRHNKYNRIFKGPVVSSWHIKD